jgi:hypothetical protein
MGASGSGSYFLPTEQKVEAIDDQLRIALTGHVLVITGSGVSAESGIPTFRDKGRYWRTHRAEELATPAAFARDRIASAVRPSTPASRMSRTSPWFHSPKRVATS